MKKIENKVKVHRTFNKNGKLITESNDEDVIFVSRIPEGVQTATITTSKDKKLNLGNFSSAGVFVSASVTVAVDIDEIENAWKFVDNFTLEKLEGILEQKFEDKKK